MNQFEPHMGAGASETVAAWSLNNARNASPAKDVKMIQEMDFLEENGFDPDPAPYRLLDREPARRRVVPKAIILAGMHHRFKGAVEKKIYRGERRNQTASAVLRQFWGLLIEVPDPVRNQIGLTDLVEQGLVLARMAGGQEVDVDVDHTGSVYWARFRFPDKSECFISGAGVSVE